MRSLPSQNLADSSGVAPTQQPCALSQTVVPLKNLRYERQGLKHLDEGARKFRGCTSRTQGLGIVSPPYPGGQVSQLMPGSPLIGLHLVLAAPQPTL